MVGDALKFSQVEEKILTIRSRKVILDVDIAELYGVKTKDVNQAVRANPDKFPEGSFFVISKDEKKEIIRKHERFDKVKFSSLLPVAFSEKSLYMLATVLKSEKATLTANAMVEVFAKTRELSRTVLDISHSPEDQRALMRRSGEIVADILGNDLLVSDTETSIEIDFALMRFKHTVKQKKSIQG
ncbi:MAG: ORF6N domain-containing protein [Prevotellaceae bacterium]|jgi:hypothetical protein|nr:ORF6N domain-containing protein [Prevotellaceae bacterium]